MNVFNDIAGYLLIFKLISFFISTGLVALIVFFLMNTETMSGPLEHLTDIFGFRDVSSGRALKAWKQIKKRLKSGEEKQWKLAVAEAEAVFDDSLKIAGYLGKTFEERVEAANHVRFFDISVDEIKQAHKLKSRIVSDPDFKISLNEAGTIVEIYKNACKELSLS